MSPFHHNSLSVHGNVVKSCLENTSYRVNPLKIRLVGWLVVVYWWKESIHLFRYGQLTKLSLMLFITINPMTRNETCSAVNNNVLAPKRRRPWGWQARKGQRKRKGRKDLSRVSAGWTIHQSERRGTEPSSGSWIIKRGILQQREVRSHVGRVCWEQMVDVGRGEETKTSERFHESSVYR